MKTKKQEIKQGIIEALQEFNIRHDKEKYSKCFETVINAICESNNKIMNPKGYAKSVSSRELVNEGLRPRYNYTNNYKYYR